MKKFKYVLLAILSVFVFAFSACEKEEAKTPTTPPAPTTPTPTTPTPKPEKEEDSTVYYDATYYDVSFCSVVAEDKLSVLIEVTPKYDIKNLKIETVFLFNSNDKEDSHINEFLNAPKDKTISFRVYLSDSLIKNEKKVEYYEYAVVGGQYQADVANYDVMTSGTGSETHTLTLHTSSCIIDTIIDIVLSENKTNLLIHITPTYNLYNLKMFVHFKIASMINIYAEDIIIGNTPANRLITYRVHLPNYLIEQGITIDDFSIQLMGECRVSIETAEE